MYDIITVGSATRDIFVKSSLLEVRHESDGHDIGCFPMGAKIELDDLVFETGGGATNAAVTFARLGYKTAAVVALGADDVAAEVRRVLDREGVSTELALEVTDAKTGTSIIAVAGTGERTILVYRGASMKIAPDAIAWDQIRAKWLYVTSVGGDLKLMSRLLDHAEAHGIKVAWNPGGKEIAHGRTAIEPLARRVDLFDLNRDEAAALVGSDGQDMKELLEAIRGLPREMLIITDGDGGTYAAAHSGETLHSGTIDVTRVNVTGAGDAFGSGLVAALARGDDLARALAVGTWNATGVVQQMGAKRGLLKAFPSDEQIAQVAVGNIG